MLSISGIGLALYQAPPWLMREYRADAKLAEAIGELYYSFNHTYKETGVLPKSFGDLLTIKPLSRTMVDQDFIQKNNISYEILNNRSINLCTTYAHDSRKSQRLYHGSSLNFKAGSYCEKFTMGAPVKVAQCVSKCWEGHKRY